MLVLDFLCALLVFFHFSSNFGCILVSFFFEIFCFASSFIFFLFFIVLNFLNVLLALFNFFLCFCLLFSYFKVFLGDFFFSLPLLSVLFILRWIILMFCLFCLIYFSNYIFRSLFFGVFCYSTSSKYFYLFMYSFLSVHVGFVMVCFAYFASSPPPSVVIICFS